MSPSENCRAQPSPSTAATRGREDPACAAQRLVHETWSECSPPPTQDGHLHPNRWTHSSEKGETPLNPAPQLRSTDILAWQGDLPQGG